MLEQICPDFECIGLHGIYSWIADENRQVIVAPLGRRLKVGGVRCFGYNALPGWTAFAPMCHLITERVKTLGSSADHGIVSRIDGAFNFAEKLSATKRLFGQVTSVVVNQLNRATEYNRHYLLRDY